MQGITFLLLAGSEMIFPSHARIVAVLDVHSEFFIRCFGFPVHLYSNWADSLGDM